MESKVEEEYGKNINAEPPKFVFVSVLFFVGFCIIYLGGVSLNSLTLLQANFIELFTLGIQEHSIFEVFVSTGILTTILGLIIFCLGLSYLAVKKLDKLKYFLIIPILCSGFLFNFSVLFLFFALGLFISSLYVIPLGETYKQELKKWKKFRVGSNAVSKALFVLFLFVFLGSFVSFSVNDSYQQLFLNSTISSISNIFKAETSNFNNQIISGNFTDKFIDEQMNKIREQYPNLTEKQYLAMESKIRESLEEKVEPIKLDEFNLSSVISQGVENSLLLKAFLAWFPLIMSLTIWVILEFLRGILLSPISGVFSYILFYIFRF